MRRLIKLALLQSFLGAAALGCVDPELRCQMNTAAGACVSTLSVLPRYLDQFTSNVDVVRNQCEVEPPKPGAMGAPPTPARFEPEPFTDHSAVLTVSNQPPAQLADNPDRGSAVVLDRYDILFHTNGCPSCPDLSLISIQGPTTTLLSGTSVEITLPLVPLRTKAEYVDEGGPLTAYPSFSAHFQIYGHDKNGPFVLEADTEFTIGNYDVCKLRK